jgi:hypothetical protein
MSLSDCEIVPTDTKPSSVESGTDYLSKCIEMIKEAEGDVPKILFAPGDITNASHDSIRDLLCSTYGYAVVIINQNEKRLYIPDDTHPDGYRTYQITSKNTQISDMLYKIWHKHIKGKYPVAITGNKMFGRGATLCSGTTTKEPFVFTHGILRCTDAIVGYQRVARMLGNIKNLYNHHKLDMPTIYLNKSAIEPIKLQEQIAHQLPVIALAKDKPLVSMYDIDYIENECISEVEGVSREWYKGYDENGRIDTKTVIERAKKIGMKRPQVSRLTKTNSDGFVESNLTPGKWTILQPKTLKRSKNCGLNAKVKYKIWPCYNNPSDPKSLVYALVWHD